MRSSWNFWWSGTLPNEDTKARRSIWILVYDLSPCLHGAQQLEYFTCFGPSNYRIPITSPSSDSKEPIWDRSTQKTADMAKAQEHSNPAMPPDRAHTEA
jgi:hypothetical protein